MPTFTEAEAKAKFGELIGMVEAGEEITITRGGEAIARLVRSAPLRQQLPSLAELRARLPLQSQPAGEFIRELRDTDRY